MAAKLKLIGIELVRYAAFATAMTALIGLFLWVGWALFICYWLQEGLRLPMQLGFAGVVSIGAMWWLKRRIEG